MDSRTPPASPPLPPTRRGMPQRATSQWSDHHNVGTSYFPPASTSPRSPGHTFGRNRATRSTSFASYASPSRHRQKGKNKNNRHSTSDDEEEIRSLSSESASPDADDDEAATPRPEETEVTLKERQSMINDEHPFGLPIWKPALYKKSRTVTREADIALHSVPSAIQSRHRRPGNVIWLLLFGWWLALQAYWLGILLGVLNYVLPGENDYSSVFKGLGWYLLWPFGRSVEDTIEPVDAKDGTVDGSAAAPSESGGTIRQSQPLHAQSTSWNSQIMADERERRSLLAHTIPRLYGAIPTSYTPMPQTGFSLRKAAYYVFLFCNVIPCLLIASIACWALIAFIPMAKLNWELVKNLTWRADSIKFRDAPSGAPTDITETTQQDSANGSNITQPTSTQTAVHTSSKADSTVILCIYRAAGLRYFKYTVGGVNILFVNLLPLVFFVIFDAFVLMPLLEKKEHHGEHVGLFLGFIASQGVIFALSLASVIPLSYFIGMAVASISAQSSIGMGAVINATFGSIIEIILYGIALTRGKGLLVEGSIVGSILAGVLLMPGASMVSGAWRKKEMRFNAKSAGVTSTMLIMAMCGVLTPSLFYGIYGNVSRFSHFRHSY